MPRPWTIVFWAFIALLLAFNIYRFTQKNWSMADPIDFRGLYLGAEMLVEGQDMYNDSLSAELWLQHKAEEGFESNSDFGDQWVSVMTYPPHAFSTFYPISLLSWTNARKLWWFIAGLCLLIAGYGLYLFHKDPTAIGLILAFKGSVFALMLGQPMLLALALLSGSVLFHKNRKILSGVLLGLAMFKFTLAIPFGLWFLLKKNFKLIAVGAVTTTLLFLPGLIQNPNIIPEYLAQISKYYGLIYTPDVQNMYTFSNSEIGIMLDYYWNKDISFWKSFNSIGQLLGYGLFAYLYLVKGLKKDILLLGLVLVSFVFSYHLVYDGLILLIPLFYLKNLKVRTLSAWLVLTFSLPINAISDLELIKFHYPLLIFMALLVLIFVSFKNRSHDQRPHPSH